MELLGRSSLAVWKFFGDNYSDNAERVAKQRWNEFMKKNLTKNWYVLQDVYDTAERLGLP